MNREASPPPVAMQFETAEQQHEARALGMWLFLITELLLFGGIFAAWSVYYYLYPQQWVDASSHMHMWLATVNTAVLLTSSLTMALAVHAAREQKRGSLRLFALATAVLGSLFLVIKGYEWWLEVGEGLAPFATEAPIALEYGPATELFMNLYFVATGLHALHLTAAVLLVLGIAGMTFLRGLQPFDAERAETIGLFWHLVDVVWVVLYPMFYLLK